MIVNEKKSKVIYPFPVNNPDDTITVPNIVILRDMLMEPRAYIHALGAVAYNLSVQSLHGECTVSSFDTDTLQCLYNALVELSDMQQQHLEITIINESEVEEVENV